MADELVSELCYICSEIRLLKSAADTRFSIVTRVLLGHLARGLWICRLVAKNAETVLEAIDEDEEPRTSAKDIRYLKKIVERRDKVDQGFMLVIEKVIRYTLYTTFVSGNIPVIMKATHLLLPGFYKGSDVPPEPYWNVLDAETVQKIGASYQTFVKQRDEWMEANAELSLDSPEGKAALPELMAIIEDFTDIHLIKDTDDPETLLWGMIEAPLERMDRTVNDILKIEAADRALSQHSAQ